jgi:radical SAM superfamily enzyme YgiQ (UPF0313 family)
MPATPDRFYRRFTDGACLVPGAPRLTTEASEGLFARRDDGLRVLMINAPIREWSYPNIMPIGHGYVGAAAVMDGHTLDVLDLNAERRAPVKAPDMPDFDRWVERRVEEKLGAARPDVIGLGGIITQYGRIRSIARICKRMHPDVPIVLGGGIASSMPAFMLRRMPIDVVVQEEGEVTFSEVLHRIEMKASLAGVAGVAYRDPLCANDFTVRDNGLRPSLKSREQGLDAVPWPIRSRWPEDEVYKQNPVGHLNWKTKWIDGGPEGALYSVSMIASRGCPYAGRACDYCYAAYLGKQYRLRSPREVVDEMEYCRERYGVAYIHFLDDLMLTDYRWALEFTAALRERKARTGFEVMWGGTCRTNIIADDILRARREGRPHMLELAHEVGMRQAGFGIESGSPTVLKAIDKSGQTVEKMELAIAETQRVLGYADCSFMIGSPGETRQTVRETVEFCKRVGLRPEVFFFTTAYPATAFWPLALDKGLIRKAVTGEKGPADEDMIEQYFLRLGEQGEEVRTNFSDLPDEEVVDLSWWAITELGAQNVVRHPHTGEAETRKPAVRGASRADL